MGIMGRDKEKKRRVALVCVSGGIVAMWGENERRSDVVFRYSCGESQDADWHHKNIRKVEFRGATLRVLVRRCAAVVDAV